MKVVFICGSLEQGRDGVGDYVRQLALSLAEAGHEVAITAINDRFTTGVLENTIETGLWQVKGLRLPEMMDAKEKAAFLKGWISVFSPDWISLQYVPFSFHRKGLCFGLANMLHKAGGKAKWHFMVHEFSVGLDVESDLKLRIWGFVQQYLMKNLIRVLKPQVIHTHAQVYKKLLEGYGAEVGILPLFSNIPVLHTDNVSDKLATKADEHSIIDIVVFASIQENSPIEQLAKEAAAYAKAHNKMVNLVFLGRSGSRKQYWIDQWESAGLTVDLKGEQPEEKVSEILSKVRFGIFTTPIVLVEKSGAVAAMREHGVHLLCVSRAWNSRTVQVGENPFAIPEYREGELEAFFKKQPDFSYLPTLKKTTEQFVSNLSSTDNIK